MEPSKNNPISVPVAIVIAGLLIAGAVFLARSDNTPTTHGEPEGAGGPGAISALFDSGGEEAKSEPQDIGASLGGIPPIQPGTEHILGNPNADIVIIEYSDLECPFCRVFHQTLQRVIDEHGKTGTVAWAYRHLPLTQLHSKAAKEAEATECAAELGGNEGFWKYTNRLFDVTPSNNGLNASELPKIAEYANLDVDAFNACLESGTHISRVQKDYNDATRAGGNGTPFSILLLQKPLTSETVQEILPLFDRYRDPRTGLPPIGIAEDGMRMSLSGAMPYEIMKSIIDILTK